MFEVSDTAVVATIVMSFLVGYGIAGYYLLLRSAVKGGPVGRSDRLGIVGGRTDTTSDFD